MNKQINSLLKKAMWVSIILFGIRCAVSFDEIKTNPSLYSFLPGFPSNYNEVSA